MSEAQDIFRKVLDPNKGCYKVSVNRGCNRGMCFALEMAVDRGYITREEYDIAKSAIDSYLIPHCQGYLHMALPLGIEPNREMHYPEVYYNWDYWSQRGTTWGCIKVKIKGWFK